MEFRTVGKTDMKLSPLGFGASSLGAEFRQIDIPSALRCVHVAIDGGMNFIDTSPFYGRGMSEIMLGRVLPEIPRDRYYLGTKLGRYSGCHFDFSAQRVVESIDISLERMKVDYLDVILCHDLEFVDMSQIINETLPAMAKVRQQGKVRYIGVSGYPMKMFHHVIDNYDLDVILSYNHYTLQNTLLLDLLPKCQQRGIGVLNAAPFSARLLTADPLPTWHRATDFVRQTALQAVQHCQSKGVDIAQLALQFSISNEQLATCITGSANPDRVAQWIDWAEQPLDRQLLEEVLEILKPIHNWRYIEGRAENNDPLPVHYQSEKFQKRK